MVWRYILSIEEPKKHLLKVKILAKRPKKTNIMRFYMPIWSDGSRIPNLFCKNILKFNVTSSSGKPLYYEKTEENLWEIVWDEIELKKEEEEFEINYLVYCYGPKFENSFIDELKASLTGASIFMGLEGISQKKIEVSVRFPALWSKLNTNFKDISNKRDEFLYEALNQDDLFNGVFELGCHETDGFRVAGVDHYLAQIGSSLAPDFSFKEDFKYIVEGTHKIFKEISYDQYFFSAQFERGKSDIRSGHNYSSLKFDTFNYSTPSGRVEWIMQATESYLKSCLDKQIRLEENTPWDYCKGSTSPLIWHQLGILRFLRIYLPLKWNLITPLDFIQSLNHEIKKYSLKAGGRFQTLGERSLEYNSFKESEMDQWGKVDLEKKSMLIFFLIHLFLRQKGKGIEDLLVELTFVGHEKGGAYNEDNFFQILESLGGKEVKEFVETSAYTNEEMNVFHYLKGFGISVEAINQNEKWPFLGANFLFLGERVYIKNVILDGPSFKAGLNKGDELLAINGLRVLKNELQDFLMGIQTNTHYNFMISRRGKLKEVSIFVENCQIPFYEMDSNEGNALILKLLG